VHVSLAPFGVVEPGALPKSRCRGIQRTRVGTTFEQEEQTVLLKEMFQFRVNPVIHLVRSLLGLYKTTAMAISVDGVPMAGILPMHFRATLQSGPHATQFLSSLCATLFSIFQAWLLFIDGPEPRRLSSRYSSATSRNAGNPVSPK
jgi:hypothetical protein